MPRGLSSAEISAAALYRVIGKLNPTILVDEADTMFRQNDDLQQVVNSGWTRGSGVIPALPPASCFPVWRIPRSLPPPCARFGVERATPHDLRRTHGSTITALGFGRDAMNRVQNHIEGGIATVYDRHRYAEENKSIMEAVANKDRGAGRGQAGQEGCADQALNLIASDSRLMA